MVDETYMGVPRSKIPWHPHIDYEKCDLCQGDPQCLKFCPHGVFSVEGNPPKLLVKGPNNCVVFCRSCRKVCPPDALSFPEKGKVLAVIQELREKKLDSEKKEEERAKVIIVPCSGIGKAVGQATRIAAYKIMKDKPKTARTLCLALLTVGDEDARKLVSKTPCISIDGCPNLCAAKNIEASKGKLVAKVMATEVLKNNKGLRPEGIIELNPDGLKLADLVAKEVAAKIDAVVD
jgi:NAD-dependent dihydropyrimidine dehydrogenase PreA subunit/uncharacterized metal-binding protein